MEDLVGIVGSIFLIAVFAKGIVAIIKASKTPGGSKMQRGRFEDLEADMVHLETETEELRSRVEVLEKIVTDEKYQLEKEFNNLAS